MLLIAGHSAASDAEDVEEVVVEAVGLAFFVGRVLPVLGKGGGAGADFDSRIGASACLLTARLL